MDNYAHYYFLLMLYVEANLHKSFFYDIP